MIKNKGKNNRLKSKNRSVCTELGNKNKRKNSHRVKIGHFSSANLFRLLFWTAISVGVIVYLVFLYNTFVKPYSNRWNAVYRTFIYPKGTIRGIDVSRYQKEIDWETLKNAKLDGAPVSFVFIKATEGSDIIDKYYNYNFYNARRNRIIRGAYHYFTTKSSAIEQAKFFCRTVQLEKGDLPPVLDIETIGNYNKERLQSETQIWLDYVERYFGVKPIIYSSHKFITDYLDSNLFKTYPCWIAHYYVDSLKYNGKWTFWQHSDVGKVEGVDGFVDVNVFNGSYEDLLELTLK